MFRMLRCPKCNHAIIEEGEFIQNINERMNINHMKMRKAVGHEYEMLKTENKMYYCYMKQVLDLQYELKNTELKNTAILNEVLDYCKKYRLLSERKLAELKERACGKQQRQAANVSKKLEQVYGATGNCFCNKTMPDPTARKAMNRVMRRDRVRNENWNEEQDECMDPICTNLPYSPKFI